MLRRPWSVNRKWLLTALLWDCFRDIGPVRGLVTQVVVRMHLELHDLVLFARHSLPILEHPITTAGKSMKCFTSVITWHWIVAFEIQGYRVIIYDAKLFMAVVTWK